MFQRAVPVLLAVFAAGCLEGGSVALTFSSVSATPSPGTGFKTDAATGYEAGGFVVLMAGDSDRTLQATLTGPFKAGDVARFGEAHNTMSFQQGTAGWSSDTGSITFTKVSPSYVVVFDNIVMRAGSGPAVGEFTLSGRGTFTYSSP